MARNAHLYPPNPLRGKGLPIGTAAPLPVGIIPEIQGAPRLYRMSNKWRGVQGDRYITVWAGRLESDPNIGVLLVTWKSVDLLGLNEFIESSTHRVPSSGALRIVGFDGLVLTIETESGTQLRFDAGSNAFITGP